MIIHTNFCRKGIFRVVGQELKLARRKKKALSLAAAHYTHSLFFSISPVIFQCMILQNERFRKAYVVLKWNIKSLNPHCYRHIIILLYR